jgi:hypothetical protein
MLEQSAHAIELTNAFRTLKPVITIATGIVFGLKAFEGQFSDELVVNITWAITGLKVEDHL